VQCPLYESVLEEVLSLKHCTLDTCGVRYVRIFIVQARLCAVVLLYSSFQPFCKLSIKSHYKNSYDHTHNSLFVGMVSQAFLKLFISLLSVDKIRPVIIVQFRQCIFIVLRQFVV
jgi:hypothetical protein